MLSVSAIVPTCNRPDLLKRALQSIAAQDRAPFEIIVVDDAGARKEMRQLIQRWGFSTVRVSANSRSKGVSGARNTGAEHATGEVLAFLDDDDEWLPAYLSKVIESLGSNNLDVVCCDLLCRFEGGKDRPARSAPSRLLPEAFLTRNPGLLGSNLTLKRSLYQSVNGFDESLPALEDQDLGLRLSLHGKVRYGRLRQQLVRQHHHNGARLTTAGDPTMRAGVRRFYELHSPRMTAQQRTEFRANAGLYFGVDEYGNDCSQDARVRGELLLPTLKTWLEQKRRGHTDR